ncbi:MAG TPA: uracil-DNA glycosylase [Polyangiaceae bacterium]|nr:uracil-DNA glycosylase [Polyangiaceae bacterium]
MGEGGEAEVSAREALRSLVGAARAWLELHRDAGTFGLPSAGEAGAPDEGDAPRALASVVALAPFGVPPAEAPAPQAFGPGHEAAAAAPFARDQAGREAHEAGPAPAFGAPPGAGAAFEPGPRPSGPGARQAAPAPGPRPPGPPPVAPPAVSQGALFSVGVDAAPLRAGAPLGVEVPEGAEARLVRLQVLAGEAAGCTRCRLHAGRTKSVFARGNPRARIMFVGEGPGADEDVRGLPFVGKAGQLLDRMVAAMGLQQDEIYIGNVVKCRPPQNRKPEPDEMSACVPFLAEQIALVEPEVIIALGGTAAEGLLGGRIAITRARGQWRLYRATIPVMPTYHPAYLLRNPPAKREVWDDLRAVLQRLGRPIPGKGA